jgi:hypothetical protein
MAQYEITVSVEYIYTVEADSIEEAEKQGWEYEEYAYNASVLEIEVASLEGDDDDDESEVE